MYGWRNILDKDKDESGSSASVIKRVSDGGMYGNYALGLSGSSTPALTHASIMRNPEFSAGVRVISESVSAIPFDLIRETKKNGMIRREKITDHWAAKLMNRPNSFMTRSQLYEFMIANAVLGKGALLIKTMVGNQTRELMPVNNWTMEILSDPRDGYQFRVNFTDGKQRVFPRHQCVFLSNLALDGFESISVVDNARQTVATQTALEKQQQAFAETGGMPRAALTFEQNMTKEQRAEIRNEWVQQSQGNTDGLFLLGGNAKLVPLTGDLSGQSAMDARKYSKVEAATHLNLHPAYLNSDGGFKFKDYSDLKAYHIETCIRPWIIRLEEVFTRDLLSNEAGLYFDGDEKSLLRGSLKEQIETYTLALGKGGTPAIYSINQVLDKLGEDAIDEEWAKVPSRGGYATAAGMTEDDDADKKKDEK